VWGRARGGLVFLWGFDAGAGASAGADAEAGRMPALRGVPGGGREGWVVCVAVAAAGTLKRELRAASWDACYLARSDLMAGNGGAGGWRPWVLTEVVRGGIRMSRALVRRGGRFFDCKDSGRG